MSSYLPSSSSCHALQLPRTEKDDRLNLSVRTGSASLLFKSFVFTFGGLTVGLELNDSVTVEGIHEVFTQNVGTNRLKKYSKYLSGELFLLDIISKQWSRIEILDGEPQPKPRMFHELASDHDSIFLFGGLCLDTSKQDSNTLVPCNDLWKFDLRTCAWKLLHDGSGWEDRALGIPEPRYCHKMTNVNNLLFARRKDHTGLIIAGGQDLASNSIHINSIYDITDDCYLPLPADLRSFIATTNLAERDEKYGLDNFENLDAEKRLLVNYLNSIIVNYSEELEYQPNLLSRLTPVTHERTVVEESIVLYCPTSKSDVSTNPLLSFKVGKKFSHGRPLAMQKKKHRRKSSNVIRTVPHNLRYPTGGLFGENFVITGFLPNDFDISIFIFNRPTGKWSRLNIFCNHDYGSHRFWGGFAWTSHHKVVLLGNYYTSRTTSSVRYFSSMITVDLPVTNILASLEMAESQALAGLDRKIDESSSTSSFSNLDIESSSSLSSDADDEHARGGFSLRKLSNMSARSEGKGSLHNASFNEYVHYAAPKAKFSKVRSVLLPAAITLGRNAFDRYGDMISDFELISATGDRIPTTMYVLIERWGPYFINLLSRAYVRAVNGFEMDQQEDSSVTWLRSSKSSEGSITSKLTKSSRSSDEQMGAAKPQVMAMPLKPGMVEAPKFRLPFQDSLGVQEPKSTPLASVDPTSRSTSEGEYLTDSEILTIPPQRPIPNEPIPAIPPTPASFRSSRKNSAEPTSPRGSLIHALTTLRNIPNKSPRESPFASPRGSISFESQLKSALSEVPSRRALDLLPDAISESSSKDHPLPEPLVSLVSDQTEEPAELPHTAALPGHALLDFQNIDPLTYKLEPSLIPRKLYVPYGTSTLKAFAEYLYTGQVGNKWNFRPCALDCLMFSRYGQLPLLYDLLCEVFYGIIGRKEAQVVKEGRRLREMFADLFEKANYKTNANFKLSLDEYEGFMDTVDDGYLDIMLLKKASSISKGSVSSSRKSTVQMEELSTMLEEKQKEDSDEEKPVKEAKEGSESSNSDGDTTEPDILFLDHKEKKLVIGPRSKSVFDRNQHESNTAADVRQSDFFEEDDELSMLTLEQLVSPDLPVPSDRVIDLIYEAASQCADVKLMLRSRNARQMAEALRATQHDYDTLYEKLKPKFEPEHARPSVVLRPSMASTLSAGASSGMSGQLSPVRSPNSPKEPLQVMGFLSRNNLSLRLHTIKSASSLVTAGSLEMSKTPSIFKMPFKHRNERAFTVGMDPPSLVGRHKSNTSASLWSRNEDAGDAKSILSHPAPDDVLLIFSGATTGRSIKSKRKVFSLRKAAKKPEEAVAMHKTKLALSLSSSSSKNSRSIRSFFTLKKKS